ncbi:SymE family type I addiction module toxin [Erwinia amylovora]
MRPVSYTRLDVYKIQTQKGHWMAELGFDTGQKIEVITEPGQLIIRLAGEG